MARSYNSRRDLLCNGLRSIEGITLVAPQGAFYAFPQLPQNVPPSLEFCKRALEDEGLALVPGIAFGDDRCVRFSCAVSSEIINDGLNRFRRVLKTF